MKSVWVFIIILMSAVPTAYAVKMESIYEVQMPVTSQSEQQREQAMQQAFKQVLTKVSGNSIIGENSVIKAALLQAKDNVQEFSYVSSNNSAAPFLLRVKFDPQAIKQLLRQANVSIWHENQPLVTLTFIVNGIAQQDDLRSLMRFIKQASLIRAFEIENITGDQVIMQLTIQGPRQAFIQETAVEQHLHLELEEANQLTYLWKS